MTDLIAGIQSTPDTIQHIELDFVVLLINVAALLLSSIAARVERQIGPDHCLDDGDIVIDDLLLEMELA